MFIHISSIIDLVRFIKSLQAWKDNFWQINSSNIYMCNFHLVFIFCPFPIPILNALRFPSSNLSIWLLIVTTSCSCIVSRSALRWLKRLLCWGCSWCWGVPSGTLGARGLTGAAVLCSIGAAWPENAGCCIAGVHFLVGWIWQTCLDTLLQTCLGTDWLIA